jgi:hypothetical protein
MANRGRVLPRPIGAPPWSGRLLFGLSQNTSGSVRRSLKTPPSDFIRRKREARSLVLWTAIFKMIAAWFGGRALEDSIRRWPMALRRRFASARRFMSTIAKFIVRTVDRRPNSKRSSTSTPHDNARLWPTYQVRGSVVLANFGDGIGHNSSPRKNRLLEHVDDGRADLVAVWRYVFDGADAPPARSGLVASPRSNFAIKAAKASGCSFVVR